jgi:SAM-dependent methyltransferase
MKKIGPQDKVLHFSFGDEPFGKASVFCGQFTKRQIANKSYKPLDPSVIKLPFKDKAFDVVYISHVLQYVNHPTKVLEEIKRISRSAHIKEHSEFSEVLFGWTEHKWVLVVENGNLIIKEKNEKYGKFGPFFHGLYAEEPNFYDYVSANEGLFKIAVDWYEEDDEITLVDVDEDEEFVVDSDMDNTILGEMQIEEKTEDEVKDDSFIEESKIDEEEIIAPIFVSDKPKKKKIVKTVFRPCQTEYFDLTRYDLGKISDKIDVLHLRRESLL